MKYNLIKTDTTEAIAVFVDGELLQATNEHPNWDKIVAAVMVDDEKVAALFEFGKTVVQGFARFSERVTFNGGTLFFDGDPVDNSLARRVVEFYNEDLDFAPLVAFFEKVAQNPEEHSREQLYRWLEQHNFAITADGDIVAYKGVSDDGDAFLSINSGRAIVNGVVQNGKIRQAVGDVVEMPRSEVQHDPSTGCHTGLHAGTWEYASNFGHGTTLHVRINPRDVVSVPTDSGDAKMRVCRYTIIDKATGPATSALFHLADDEDFGGDVETDFLYDFYDDDDEEDYDSDDGSAWAYPPISLTVPSADSVIYNTGATASSGTSSSVSFRPTNDNYKNQPRDAQGHFIKKS